MKKIILMMVFVASTLVLNAQETEINKTDSKGRKQGYWEKKDEKTNAIRYKGNFKDNKPVGEFTFYYPSGKVKSIVTHAADGKTSRAKIYYESGKLMSYGRYTAQKKDSVWTHYDEGGWVSFRESYANDKLDGKTQVYFYTGKISETYEYKNGLRNGEWQRFFESGMTMAKGTYKNNYLNGTVTHYRPNGQRENTEMYLNGKLHGPMFYYDESGQVLGTDYYKMGKKLEGKQLEEFKKKISESPRPVNTNQNLKDQTAPGKNAPAKTPAKGNTNHSQQKNSTGVNKTPPKTNGK